VVSVLWFGSLCRVHADQCLQTTRTLIAGFAPFLQVNVLAMAGLS
jgi:hypothetical protein